MARKTSVVKQDLQIVAQDWITDPEQLEALRRDLEEALAKDKPTEYRSVFVPPNTFVSSQAFTA